jgi:hypothetical protein
MALVVVGVISLDDIANNRLAYQNKEIVLLILAIIRSSVIAVK